MRPKQRNSAVANLVALKLALAVALLWPLAAAPATPPPAPAAEAPSQDQTDETDADAELQAQLQAQKTHLAAGQDQAARALAAQQQQQLLATARIAAAAKLGALDTAVAGDTEQMQALSRQAVAATAARNQAAAALGPMLPVIERMALYPSETLLAAPQNTPDALAGLMAARGLSRLLGTEAAEWRDRQGRLAAAQTALTAAAATLATARAAQAAAAAALDRQIAAANQTALAANQAAKQEQALAQMAGDRASSLRALVTALTARRLAEAQAAAQRRQAAAGLAAAIAAVPTISLGKNALRVPVAGKLVRGWGADTGAGPATGLTYQAAPNAQVIAPCSGTVVFADSFRSFGPMIILDCGNAVHFVLAGLAKLDVQVGRSLRAGEPVGTMPDWNDTTADRPALYLELRRAGQPINPTPYLAPAG